MLLLLVLAVTGCFRDGPPDSHFPKELSIADIHKGYASGAFSSHDLVSAYLAAIEQVDHELNAISIINPEALSLASALDEEFRESGVLRPLHGIPVLVKDNINTVGMPTTAGSRALRDYLPENNAFVIQKLEDAGAIVLAKTNMAEWAFSPMHTESTTEGVTRNPYELERVPAGSSGGTAAAVAANLGSVGLGTDTGNSIRGPSSHTSLVGFRTTLGLISREGIVPLFLRNDVVGPMCRSVEDATRVLEVMAGVDENDPITRHAQGRVPENYTSYLLKEGLQDARIGVLRELSDHQTDPDILHLFEEALSDLEGLGAELVDPLMIPGFDSLREGQWCAVFREDLESFLAQYVDNDTVKTLEDLIRIGSSSTFVQERLRTYAASSGRWGESTAECLNAYEDERRIAFREAIEASMDSLELDAIIYPTWNHPPARIMHFQEEYLGDNSQVMAPHTGQPAFTVPMGFTADGLPAGLQFLGRMFDEPILIRLCYAYEQGTRHRKAPAIHEPK